MLFKTIRICANITWILVLVKFTKCLTIDNQLKVVRNDCYERLAIGKKLHPKDVDKALAVTSVQECQMACTREEKNCRTFSIGIGEKGNHTCELSKTVIKETPDLKPIGTVSDVEYDLYIKKLGCKLVISQDIHQQQQSSQGSPYQDNTSHTNPHYANPSNTYESSKPVGEDHDHDNPGGNLYRPTSSQNEPFRVHSSLISIASIPNSASRPLLSDSSGPSRYGLGRPYYPNRFTRPDLNKLPSYYDVLDDRPPYRPQYLNYPYNEEHGYPLSRPILEDRFDDNRYTHEDRLHDHQFRPVRPLFSPDRPETVYSHNNNRRPYRPHQIPPPPPLDNTNHYDSRPQRPDEVPNPPSNYEFRPYRPNRIPERPEVSEYRPKPHRPNEVPERPEITEYRPRPLRPNKVPERPDVTEYRPRPHRPDKVPERPEFTEYRPRPLRPDKVPERPEFTEYRPRPLRPDKVPERPDIVEYRPRPTRPDKVPEPPFSDAYRPRPHRPVKIPERPLNSVNEYEENSQLSNDYDRYDFKPFYGYNSNPQRPDYVPKRPRPPPRIPERPLTGYGDEVRPSRPEHISDGPLSDTNNDKYGTRPDRPNRMPDRLHVAIGYGPQSLKPFDRYPSYGYQTPSRRPSTRHENSTNFNESYGKSGDIEDTPPLNSSHSTNDANDGKRQEPIITKTVGPNGETITSIITEIRESCFRRALAGKRIVGAFVRRAVTCERVAECQRECSDERRFVCEGFNYRLDPTGRGQGDCELLDLPLSRLDIRLDVYNDPDYDYYERDRNNDAPDCKGHRFYGLHGSGNGGGDDGRYYHSDRNYDYSDYHRYGSYYEDYGHGEYDDGYRYINRRGGKKYNHHDGYQNDYDKSYDYHSKHHYDEEYRPDDYKDLPPHRDDYEYKPSYPPPSYDYKSSEPYLPIGYWKQEKPLYESGEYWRKYFEHRVKDKQHWGFRNDDYNGWGSYGGAYGNFGAPDSYYSYDYYNDRYKNNNRHDYGYYDKKYYYVPSEDEQTKDWGRYGGSYGYGGQNHHRDGYNYWGFKRIDTNGHRDPELLPPYQDRPHLNGNDLPPYDDRFDRFDLHHNHDHQDPHVHHSGQTDVYFRRDYDDFLKNECSLRMVTGFRLHRGLVKKLIGVPNIYECELLCFKETDFPCNSYAYKYTTVPNSSPENCYLCDRDYKELDYYTDLQPDRDCDIYSMNNRNKCGQTNLIDQSHSDCFWRVRSGQRLDQRIVRDSLNAKSIVDCQIECLRSHRFTCRAFSFRYGSPILGGAIDNCQLTDIPFIDLDPRIHFVPEPGFELYERGSYGHGCEPNHFYIGAKHEHGIEEKLDQICYVGYGVPARLLPQATKKSIRVETEARCKAECTKAREKSLFQCMSLSFQVSSLKGNPNCDLSDIIQRDLLLNVDYAADPDSWLFAWDIHNPRCAGTTSGDYPGNYGGGGVTVSTGGGGSNGISHSHGTDEHYYHEKEVAIPWLNPGYTWKIYSVGGLPCKRGSSCKENKIARFWYCELESNIDHAWDYCCRPDHQCGHSEGFPYQWCYVGSDKSQWRTCNDRYYPYTSNNDRFDRPHHHSGYPSNSIGSNHGPDFGPPTRPGSRPDRPSIHPTLDNYETSHDDQFLDPPKPGGFGQSRHWPLSYLHKEMPPNDTISNKKFDYLKTPQGRFINSQSEAITNVIDVIKSNDQYRLPAKSDNTNDILLVPIPLPTNSTDGQKSKKITKEEKNAIETLQAIDVHPNLNNTNNAVESRLSRNSKTFKSRDTDRRFPIYRRSYITKTNRTELNTQIRERRR